MQKLFAEYVTANQCVSQTLLKAKSLESSNIVITVNSW